MLGMNTKKIKEITDKLKYKKIFFLEQLQYKKDNARIETEKFAKQISEKLY